MLIRAVPATLATLAAAQGSEPPHLYSNGSPVLALPALALSPITISGIPAPAGKQWSEAQSVPGERFFFEANAVAGFAGHAAAGEPAYRFTDDFVVPGPNFWNIRDAYFYAYATDALAAQPFASINLRVWVGPPDAPGSVVVFGDTLTNRLFSQSPTPYLRVFNTRTPPRPATPDSTRPLWALRADTPSLRLAPGVYWIDWQISMVEPAASAFFPPASGLGSRATANPNARQLRPDPLFSSGLWGPLVDPGKPEQAPDQPQDMPFILRGFQVCPADLNADASVDLADFFDFLNAYDLGQPAADLTGDGQVDLADFFAFFDSWDLAC